MYTTKMQLKLGGAKVQVTAQVTGYRPEVTGQVTGHRSHKKTIGLEKTVLD